MSEQALSTIARISFRTPIRRTIGQRWHPGTAASWKTLFSFSIIVKSIFCRTRTIRLFWKHWSKRRISIIWPKFNWARDTILFKRQMTCICVWGLKNPLTKGLKEDDSRLLGLTSNLNLLSQCSAVRCHKSSLWEKAVGLMLYPKMVRLNTMSKVLLRPKSSWLRALTGWIKSRKKKRKLK